MKLASTRRPLLRAIVIVMVTILGTTAALWVTDTAPNVGFKSLLQRT